MVDYSKWDKLELDSDDSDDGGGGNASSYPANGAAPRVTRLQGPSSVTIENAGHEPVLSIHGATTSNQTTAANQAAPSRAAASTTRATQALTKNGAREVTFAWAQDERHVHIHLFLPAGARAKDVAVSLSPNGELRVRYCSKSLCCRKLAGDVWGAAPRQPAPLASSKKNEDQDLDMDWELQDLPPSMRPENDEFARCVSISLTKFTGSNLLRTIWWSRAFEGGDEKDVDLNEIAQSTGSGGGQAFAKAWREAQDAFRAKVKADRDNE
ncbi:Hypothetical Protein FCC1311_000922 [Hondaea fermentalgiana]|uniref:CS domain-containing protein n=1 Tax=Hondaea fermentalgiana TaxID=2315210 RepID=A0A2R5G601_9STRA|nr:Hypothetical Protein FCC1311_000922 [Hondaea fermentalgiana]|eukprot:GBG23873.1 Hypothetical Protein FCC1311_000922 [Hondaea fermentalgiana]